MAADLLASERLALARASAEVRVPLGHITRRPNFVCFDFMCFAARENRDGNVEHAGLLAVTRMYRHFCGTRRHDGYS
jgi:hypothetical protein